MKKLLFALTLFSIMPLCAMKRKRQQEDRSTNKQNKLDRKLNYLIKRKEWLPIGREKIKVLLEKGANPNAKFGGKPLLFSADNRHTVRMLLDYGANMLQTDSEGNTVFHHGSTIAHLVLLLLYAQEHGLSLKKITSQKNKNGKTPLSLTEEWALLPPPVFRVIYSNDSGDSEGADRSCTSNDLGTPNAMQKRLLILTDPDQHIPLFYPELIEQVRQEKLQQKQMKNKLEKTDARSIHQYLLNREIGRNRQTPWRN